MKPIPTPEEAKALKEARKARKAQHGNVNLPVVEMRIPWCWRDEPANGPIAGKEIALDTESGQHWLAALEHGWRVNQRLRGRPYDGPIERKVIRT